MRYLLAFSLIVLEPTALAFAAAGRLAAIADRGWPAIVFLVFRLAVAGLAMRAGVALWQGRPSARALTRTALALLLVAALGAQWNAIWPGQLAPGLAGPALAFTVIWYGGWIWASGRMRNDD